MSIAGLFARTRPGTVLYSVTLIGGVLLAAAAILVVYVLIKRCAAVRVRTNVLTLAAAFALVTAATIVVVLSLTGSASPATAYVNSETVSGSITSPRSGVDDVTRSSDLDASGTARNVRAGHSLWLFLYVASVNKYYPSDPGAITLSGTRWAGRIFVGGSGQPGERFTLWLVDFGPQSVRVLNPDSPGPSPGYSTLKLGPDATILSSISFSVV